MTDAALHTRTTQSDGFPPTAIALAISLHVLLVAGLWWIAQLKPVIPPENVISVVFEDEGNTTLKEARPSLPPTEVTAPPVLSTPPQPPSPPPQQAALAPPAPAPPAPSAEQTPPPPDTTPPVAEQTPPPPETKAPVAEQTPPPATKPVAEEALKPPPPPPPPAPTSELQDVLPPPDYVPPPTANEFPKPAPPPPQPQPPQQAATPPPPTPPPPVQQPAAKAPPPAQQPAPKAPPQPRPAPPPAQNRDAALQPSPLGNPGTMLYGMGASGRSSYLIQIARRTSLFRYYPRAALENRERGRVVVRITLTRDGRVVDARIAQSSGSRSIDAAEVETVLKSSPFPPLPPDIPGERVAFEVPVNYDLPN